MRETFILLLVVIYFTVSPDAVFSGSMPWIGKAALHNLIHANVFHLASNILVFWMLYAPRRRHRWLLLVLSFAIGTLAFAASTGKSVGTSDMIFATIGLLTPSFRAAWWRRPETVVFLVVTALCIFVPFISATTHIAAFVCGVLLARLGDVKSRMSNDYYRAAGRD